MIVGITGGSGCGKTTALKAIRDLGGLVLDCDEIYHRLLRTDSVLLSSIEARFPGVVEGGKLCGMVSLGDLATFRDTTREASQALSQISSHLSSR